LTLTKSNVGSGSALAINNSGTGADIYGTSGTWQISAAGLAQFATGSILAGTTKFGSGSADGTISSNGNYDLILKTGNATTMTVTLVDGANGDVDLALNGTGKLHVTGTTTHNDALLVGAGDVTITLGDFSITDDQNAESFSLTNNTATTVGNASSTGVANVVSTSLTTGCLLNLELTEGTLNGGYYLRCWDATAGASNFSVQEDGKTTILGGAASDMLVITAGDVNMGDGSITVVDADNAATLSITNNTATSESPFVLAGSGTYTGTTTKSFLTVTPSGLTSGTGVYLPLAAVTTGKGLHITSGATQTTGSLLYVQNTGANAANTSGNIATFDMTATAITGTVNKIGSVLSVTSNRTVTTGTVADDFDTLSIIRASTINGAGSFSKAGSVLYVENQTTNTSGTITDTTNGIEIVMDADGTGDGISLTHNAVTGKGLNITSAGTTAAGVILATANSLTSGQILKLASSATAITGAGRLLYSYHSGATGTSAVLNEFKSDATDETVIAKVTASAALAAGVALQVSGASVTTGTLLDISDGNALTTGYLAKFASNSADTGTRSTVYILQDHASASGATALEVKQDGALAAIKVTAAANTTNYFKIATMNGVTLWMGNGTTANGNLGGTAGDILFNGGSNKPEYCTGTTNWAALV
jgi:hypothetical protein